MKRPALKMNVGNMLLWTERSKAAVEEIVSMADKMTRDPDRSTCMLRHECIACYYSSRGGGSAMTTQPCMSCGKEIMYSNTNTDALCIDCAKQYDLCKHCGGDIKLRVRRKKWPTGTGDMTEYCNYPDCNCPFDAPSDPNWCARGLNRADA